MRPRLNKEKKEPSIHPTAYLFIGQRIAFFLLVLGMLIFVYLWYTQNS